MQFVLLTADRSDILFNATEFRQIRKVCPDDLANLLQQLGIAVPDWNSEDEFKIYARLDDKITDKLSRLMKSDSVIGGYVDLLSLGGVDFSFSETDNALLNKVVSNQDKIISAIVRPRPVAPTKKVLPKVTSASTKKVHRIEQVQISTGLVVLGGVVAIVGIGFLVKGNPLLGGVTAAAGFLGGVIGLKGKTVVREVVTETPQTTPQETEAISSQPPFSETEIKQVLAALNLVNKIVQAI